MISAQCSTRVCRLLDSSGLQIFSWQSCPPEASMGCEEVLSQARQDMEDLCSLKTLRGESEDSDQSFISWEAVASKAPEGST